MFYPCLRMIEQYSKHRGAVIHDVEWTNDCALWYTQSNYPRPTAYRIVFEKRWWQFHGSGSLTWFTNWKWPICVSTKCEQIYLKQLEMSATNTINSVFYSPHLYSAELLSILEGNGCLDRFTYASWGLVS